MTRYLEEVSVGSQAYIKLTGIWVGEEEDNDGLSLQQERLELKADGTFKHTMAHRFAPLGDALQANENDQCESSCSGRWSLHNIRHLGADVSAPCTDREVTFESSASSRPLVEKITVCGANPAVNGFIGASCRLYPKDRFKNDGNRTGLRESREQQDELEVEDPLPTEDDAKQLAEATGRSLDACFAALMQAGSREEAAVLLLESVTDSPGGPDVTSDLPNLAEPASTGDASRSSGVSSDTPSASAEAVAEATGRPLAQCVEALRANDGKVNDAVDYLLSLPESEPAAPSSVDAVNAARLTELSGQSFEKCLQVLRTMNGHTERAAAALLGLEEGAAQDVDTATATHDTSEIEIEPDTVDEAVLSDNVDKATSSSTARCFMDDLEERVTALRGDVDQDVDAGTASWEMNNAVLRATADVEAAVDAEVDAALGTGDVSPSSPSSKRQRLD